MSRSRCPNFASSRAGRILAGLALIACSLSSLADPVSASCEPVRLAFPEVLLEVHTCSGTANAPTLVYVSPGGKGREYAGKLASGFVDQGISFVVFDYAVNPGNVPIGSPDNVAAAIAWASRHVSEYGGNPKALFVMGYSAGAHLAALVSTDERYLEAEGGSLGILAGTILLDNDVFSSSASDSTGSLLDPWGTTAANGAEVWEDVTPGNYVAPGKCIPDMLILSSGSFTGRKASDISAFVDALTVAGVGATLVMAETYTHTSIPTSLVDPDSAVFQAIIAFIRSHEGVW